MKNVGKDIYDEYVGIEICDVHRVNIFFSIDHSGKHWPGCAILVGYFGIEVHNFWQISIDPENNHCLLETHRPSPIWQGLC